jgi:hypothetical protein|tara:strand:+ start:486 stop:716 length:231 start_codon:yes stop_codon:yes gene_type:complete
MNNPEQPQMKIDLSQTVPQLCEKCQNDTFVQVYQMRKLSALLSPNGEEAMIPIQGYACSKCNHINKEFMFKEDKKD